MHAPVREAVGVPAVVEPVGGVKEGEAEENKTKKESMI